MIGIGGNSDGGRTHMLSIQGGGGSIESLLKGPKPDVGPGWMVSVPIECRQSGPRPAGQSLFPKRDREKLDAEARLCSKKLGLKVTKGSK